MLYLPQDFPALQSLRAEGLAATAYAMGGPCSLPPAIPQGAKRVLLLNLMPHKAVTDLDIARTLAQTGEDVCLLLMKIAGQTYKTTPQTYVEAFYRDFEHYAAAGATYDGLIITGAPVEQIPFEEVRYWEALCRIMDWADRSVRSTLYVCWGAQAGLYHLYGVPKYPLPEKRFGIFAQTVRIPSPLMEGLSPAFPMPNSRHTEVRAADLQRYPTLRILADSPESGVGVVASTDHRRVFIVGHLEYEPLTLDKEYRRDLSRQLPIHQPEHYYRHDEPAAGVNYVWQEAAVRFYGNWLRHP